MIELDYCNLMNLLSASQLAWCNYNYEVTEKLNNLQEKLKAT